MNARRSAVPVVVCALVVGASLLPESGAGGLPMGADKLLHVTGYAAVAGSLAYARRARTVRALASIVVFATLLGSCVEVVQPTVGRNASLLDAVANLVGATAGAGTYWLVTARTADSPAD